MPSRRSRVQLSEETKKAADGILEPENQFIYVLHSDAPEEAEEIAKMLSEKIPGCKIEMGYIGPIIGASIGADALAIFCWGKSCERFSV